MNFRRLESLGAYFSSHKKTFATFMGPVENSTNVAFCIMAERTKHIHAQRSIRFITERHKAFSERDVCETYHRPNVRSPFFRFF